MKIESVKIRNFKAAIEYDGVIGGKNVYLIGGNGRGKTSFIDAVFKGVSGKKMPPCPITDNGRKGLIEVDLGDFIARTKFKKGRPVEFELENKNFENEADKFIKSPRTYLEKRIGIIDFDINEFLNLSDSKQVEYVAKHLSLDFSDIDTDLEELYEERKYDKKKLGELKLSQDYYKPEDAEKELINIVDLSKKIETEQAKCSKVNKVEKGVSDKLSRVEEIELEIGRLNLKLETLNEEIRKGEDWLLKPVNQKIDESDLIEMVRKRDTATATNKVIQDAKDAKIIDASISKYEEAIEEANDKIASKKQEKAKRISSAINMEELTYSMTDECFLYDGRKFDKSQTNTAAQLITGMKIGSMMLKDLKIMRVDASLIDKVEFAKVLDWAKEQDIELFIELVDREATQLRIEVDE